MLTADVIAIVFFIVALALPLALYLISEYQLPETVTESWMNYRKRILVGLGLLFGFGLSLHGFSISKWQWPFFVGWSSGNSLIFIIEILLLRHRARQNTI
ncbi:MAG: hypothetical protein ACRCSO_05230 [Sphingomonas sp.]